MDEKNPASRDPRNLCRLRTFVVVPHSARPNNPGDVGWLKGRVFFLSYGQSGDVEYFIVRARCDRIFLERY